MEDSTTNSDPKMPEMVRAFAGDSTITSLRVPRLRRPDWAGATSAEGASSRSEVVVSVEAMIVARIRNAAGLSTNGPVRADASPGPERPGDGDLESRTPAMAVPFCLSSWAPISS